MASAPLALSGTAPSLEQLEVLAGAALARVPAKFRSLVREVVVRVEDFPDRETCEAMELESPFDILGLYAGVSLAEKSVADASGEVDMIFLYRRPILDYWCETGDDLEHIVYHVLVHEIGHHFGLSDDDMEAIEAAG